MAKTIELSLRENAYDFINESLRNAVRAEAEPLVWKFAISNVVQAIELMLKARLQAEHPLLIFQNVDQPKHTVSLSQLRRWADGVAASPEETLKSDALRRCSKNRSDTADWFRRD